MKFKKILLENYSKWKDREYVYEKVNESFQAITYGDFLEKSHLLAGYLLKQGLSGKKVMIYGENAPALMMADLAVLEYVGISVWISKEWTEEDVLGTLAFLDVSCIIYGEEKREIVEEAVKGYPEICCICTSDFEKIWEEERAFVTGSQMAFMERFEPQDKDICCKIVFSSGTTAAPKAAMLSKKNIFAGVESLYRRCPFHEGDVDYLFLPLHHTYGGIYNFLYSLIFGFSIYLCSDISKIGQELLEVRPTLFCGVPAIFRRLYEGYGAHIGTAFGDRIQYLFCGGASFEEEIRKAYIDAGLRFMGAYALSETASTFAIQYPGDPDTSCAGTIAEDLDVKVIHADCDGVGEVVVKGDNVFMGYSNDPVLTAKSFTEDGYFKTGDLGYILPDERNGGQKLYITGRCKKILIGENGENVEPEHLERLIEECNKNINKVLMCIKDGKLGCVLYLKEPEDRDWQAFFDEINETLPKYERIKHFSVELDSVEKRLKQ